MDIATPRNVQLSGFFRRSTAVVNAKEKIPNCLMAIANELTTRLSDIRQQYGQEAAEELLIVVSQIQCLREEVLQDVPFRKLISSGPDVKFYNDYLDKMTSLDCRPTMLQTIRVYAECYVYRRVWECFELTKTLTKFDPYESIKQALFWAALPVMNKTAQYLKNIYKYPSDEDKNDFEKLIKLNLWANQDDIPFCKDKENTTKFFCQMLNVKKNESFTICNQTELAWEVISDKGHPSNVIAFICDNVGFELFLELCLADYLYTNYYATSIHFHVKHIPWFILDAMEVDIHWILLQLGKNADKHLQKISNIWKEHFKTGRWKIIVRKYWTLPIGFTKMKEIDPVLLKMLEETKIIIIIGDLNYRKLFEDKNLEPSTPISEALTDFHPSNVLLVRIMKSEICCNIKRSECKILEKLNKNWMDSGLYGFIQFASKPKAECDCQGL